MNDLINYLETCPKEDLLSYIVVAIIFLGVVYDMFFKPDKE